MISSLLRFLIISTSVLFFILGENAESSTQLSSIFKRQCPHSLYWENTLSLVICNNFWCTSYDNLCQAKNCPSTMLQGFSSCFMNWTTQHSHWDFKLLANVQTRDKVCSSISKYWLEGNKLWKKHTSFSGGKVEAQIIYLHTKIGIKPEITLVNLNHFSISRSAFTFYLTTPVHKEIDRGMED